MFVSECIESRTKLSLIVVLNEKVFYWSLHESMLKELSTEIVARSGTSITDFCWVTFSLEDLTNFPFAF